MYTKKWMGEAEPRQLRLLYVSQTLPDWAPLHGREGDGEKVGSSGGRVSIALNPANSSPCCLCTLHHPTNHSALLANYCWVKTLAKHTILDASLEDVVDVLDVSELL